jgi:hypothetical protein
MKPFRFAFAFAALLPLSGIGCATRQAANDSAAAERKGIEFLKREVPAWSKENGCFSCHNNGDAARALYLAKRHGYSIPDDVLKDTTDWVRRPNDWDKNKGDPGFSDKRLANIQFAAALIAAMDAGEDIAPQALHAAARRVAGDQDKDGSWPVERHNPVGSPATYGTALATSVAWKILRRAELADAEAALNAGEKWLQKLEPRNVFTAAIMLLTHGTNASDSCLPLIQRAQASDGGWGPYHDSPPEVFDTALVLLALAEISSRPRVPEMIQRGRQFLTTQQQADGSWPATTRPSGGDSYAQQMSTSGWAVLALLKTR